MEFFLAPLAYSFILRGLLGGILAAMACAVLSPFVVWRKLSFMGDALAHAILPGIVVAFVLGVSLALGALVAALLAVLGIGIISQRGKLSEDAAIGVIFAGFFALGIVMMSRIATFSDLNHILFGNILGVSPTDLWVMVGIAITVLVSVVFTYKELTTASFDPAHAAAIGLSPGLVRYLLLGLLALTIVVAIQVVGIVLVLALLVTPGAAASFLSRNLEQTVVLSVILALGATVLGFYISYYIDLASGPVIVLILTVFFLLAVLFSWLCSKK